jgi:hypothetical protein
MKDDREEFLIIGFLEGKLKQAESDVNMYMLLLSEINDMIYKKNSIEKNNKFLTIVTNNQGDNK